MPAYGKDFQLNGWDTEYPPPAAPEGWMDGWVDGWSFRGWSLIVIVLILYSIESLSTCCTYPCNCPFTNQRLGAVTPIEKPVK